MVGPQPPVSPGIFDLRGCCNLEEFKVQGSKFSVGFVLRTTESAKLAGSARPTYLFKLTRPGTGSVSDCSKKFLVASASCRCGAPAGSLCHQRLIWVRPTHQAIKLSGGQGRPPHAL